MVEAFAALTGFDEENIMLSLYAGREIQGKIDHEGKPDRF